MKNFRRILRLLDGLDLRVALDHRKIDDRSPWTERTTIGVSQSLLFGRFYRGCLDTGEADTRRKKRAEETTDKRENGRKERKEKPVGCLSSSCLLWPTTKKIERNGEETLGSSIVAENEEPPRFSFSSSTVSCYIATLDRVLLRSCSFLRCVLPCYP